MADLLYEIGTEELPAGYLAPALRQLAEAVARLLREARLKAGQILTAGTPRRLTVAARGIPERQPPVSARTVGPPARVAFDGDGKPTAAAAGFARSMGVAVEDLQVEETDKGPYVVAVVEEPGRPAAELLPELLRQATAAVGFPKSMRWAMGDVQFARPIRRLVALLDDAVLPLALGGVQAGRVTDGHPFLAPGGIELDDACYETYRSRLRDRFVVVDMEERREIARREVSGMLARHGSQIEDEALLDEAANMVEWPHAVEGGFDEHFLEIPAPVLCAAMKGHQRYFPVWDADGRLVARFVTLSNSGADQEDLVRAGNERVLLARLQDARFFWEEDRRRSLDELVSRLEKVVFLAGLGNNLERTERLVKLAGRIAEAIGGDVSPEHVRRAARLCKADLLSGLVGEFPSLQGVVGCEIARAGGEPEPVARAIAEHYLPAGAGDDLPATPEGSVLALADKLDVIVACFSLGLTPSGSQDPYALRRNALGVLLIIEKKGFGLPLTELIDMARETLRDSGAECDDETAAKINEFFGERLYNAAIERGFRHDFVRAVQSAGRRHVSDFWRRLEALAACARRPWWPDLVEVVDRTFRIQRDADPAAEVRRELFEDPREKQLAALLDEHADAIMERFEAGDYTSAAELYCRTFAAPVHEFFEEVFVNVDDEDVRLNRKSLLGRIYRLFADHFADLYLIETADQ